MFNYTQYFNDIPEQTNTNTRTNTPMSTPTSTSSIIANDYNEHWTDEESNKLFDLYNESDEFDIMLISVIMDKDPDDIVRKLISRYIYKFKEGLRGYERYELHRNYKCMPMFNDEWGYKEYHQLYELYRKEKLDIMLISEKMGKDPDELIKKLVDKRYISYEEEVRGYAEYYYKYKKLKSKT